MSPHPTPSPSTGARAGQGPALLANRIIDADLANGSLIDLVPDHSVIATDFEAAAWILYPSRSHLPAKVRAFADFVRGRYA